jgi:methylenetetrahydrofolate reductase (NADPH)
VAAEGLRVCVETIQQIREIPGVAGVHLMAFGFERGVPDILAAAGFAPDRGPVPDAPPRALSAVPGEG